MITGILKVLKGGKRMFGPLGTRRQVRVTEGLPTRFVRLGIPTHCWVFSSYVMHPAASSLVKTYQFLDG